jgi:hypothetical protein
MTDRELLELAASAAGYDVTYEIGYLTFFRQDVVGRPVWNPLTDDGDALRLAVKLEIVIEPGDSWSDAGGWSTVYHCDHNDDHYAATRRAIVRAAAEIGKEMDK